MDSLYGIPSLLQSIILNPTKDFKSYFFKSSYTLYIVLSLYQPLYVLSYTLYISLYISPSPSLSLPLFIDNPLYLLLKPLS